MVLHIVASIELPTGTIAQACWCPLSSNGINATTGGAFMKTSHPQEKSKEFLQ
jgi:hypothetical protein